MESFSQALKRRCNTVPDPILWKTELLFRGVRFTAELEDAVKEGAAANYWPYRKPQPEGPPKFVDVPYLFELETGAVARVRVEDRSSLEVRRANGGYHLLDGDRDLCGVGFVKAHKWQSFRTSDGATQFEAGVEQLGDMLVVNVAPGCEYFLARKSCTFCGYGRFGNRSKALGQEQGRVELDARTLRRLYEVLRCAADSGEARHVYLTGGSMLSPELEVERYLPVVETARRAVGDRLRVTCGSGAVDRAGTARYRDAGADSCCYNLETWAPEVFPVVCPGKSSSVGRERWIGALLGAVDVFGRGNVASAFVAGVELLPPAPRMTAAAMMASILEGAAFLMDHGIMPLYSPLWPVEGTDYGKDDGLSPELYVDLEEKICRMRQERSFPVPSWLICPGCSYMLLEVDFDRAFGLAPVH